MLMTISPSEEPASGSVIELFRQRRNDVLRVLGGETRAMASVVDTTAHGLRRPRGRLALLLFLLSAVFLLAITSSPAWERPISSPLFGDADLVPFVVRLEGTRVGCRCWVDQH